MTATARTLAAVPGQPGTGNGRPTRTVRTARPDVPEGADRSRWRAHGQYGTDGDRTWRNDPDRGWVVILDGLMLVTSERTPAPDPDFPDRGTDGDDDSLEARSDVTVRYVRSGRPRERVYQGVPTRKLRDCRPLDLAGPSAWRGADLGQRGRAQVAASCIALSDPAWSEFYAVTGWHPNPAGPGEMFIHGGGAIGPNGTVPEVDAAPGSPLDTLALGDPTGNVRAALDLTARLDTEAAMPGRVLWPTLAAYLRPLFGVYRDPADPEADTASVCNAWLSGPYGAMKSGTIAAVGNAVYPSLRHNALPVKAGTSKGTGASRAGLERLGFRGRDLCLPFDDLDPSEGAAARSAWHSDLARVSYGQTSRTLAQRAGTGNRTALPWRAGFVGTGEPFDGEASATNRLVNVPIDHGDIRAGALADLTTPDARIGRAALGAGIVRALAADRSAYRSRLDAARRALRPMFASRADGVPGPVQRAADVMAEGAATLYVCLSIAVDQGMTRADARTLWRDRIAPGYREAWRASLATIDSGDRAGRAVVYLREALASGAVRLDDRTEAGQPSRDAYGWRPDPGPYGPGMVPMSGTVAGYQDRESGDLYLLPTITAGIVRTTAERAGDAWTGGTRDLGSALVAGGYVQVAPGRAGRGAATEEPRIDGRKRGVWHVRADVWESRAGAGYAGRDYAGPIDPTGVPYLDDPDDPGQAAPPAPVPPAPVPPAGPVRTIADVAAPCDQCGAPTLVRMDGNPRHGGPCTARHEAESARPADDTRPAAEGRQGPSRAAGGWVIGGARPAGTVQRAAEAAEVVTLDDLDPAEVASAARIIRAGDDGQADPAGADVRAAVVALRQATSVPGSTALGSGVRLATAPGKGADAGWTGVQWYRAVAARGTGAPLDPIDLDAGPVAEVQAGSVFRFPDHVRPGVDLAEGDPVTAGDVHGQYLGVAASVELGTGEPDHYRTAHTIGQITADPTWTRRPGYALLAAPLDLAADVPPLADLDAGTWVPLPWLDFLARPWPGRGSLLATPPRVAELVYWHEHGRRLAAWQRHARVARERLAEVPGPAGEYARTLLKRVYAGFLGGYLRSDRYNRSRETLRPDWSDMVISQAGANLYRKVIRAAEVDPAGAVPFGVFRDDVWYRGTGLPAALDAIGATGDGLGKIGHKATVTASADLTTAYRAGESLGVVQAIAALIREGEGR